MSQPPTQLEAYRKVIDADIATYSKRLLREVGRTYGPYSKVSTEAFTAILARGGKRLRGALVMAAYHMLGGKDEAVAVQVARTLEMVHAYLLMTDDIADRSSTRRGGPAAHKHMSAYHHTHQLRGDSEHFGLSIAMMSALAGVHQAELDLDNLPVPAPTKLAVLQSLHANLVHTLHGQLQDIFIETVARPTAADSLQVVTLKTAYYTFVNPLEMGALLAGAGPRDLEVLKQYGLKAGVAFQLADDLLGVFAEAKESGKSPLDDIKEGKATLLVVRALGHATPAGQRFLRQSLGNASLTMDDLQKCRHILEASGARAHVEQLAAEHVRDALAQLDHASKSWDAAQVQFLRELAVFIADRRA